MQDLRITLIQSNLHWENSELNLQMFSEKINAIKEETDIIVLPEMFSTGFTMNAKQMAESMEGTTVQWMKKMSEKKNCIITGSIIIKEDNKFYNRLLWITPEKISFYNKRHLFSYAGEDKTYTGGDKKIIVHYKGWNILPLVCYDLRFPVWNRRTNNDNYDLIIYVANWPERRIHAWKQLLIARAIENQCYVAGLNRVGNDGNNIYHSGESAVIDFKGEQLLIIDNKQEFISTTTLSKNNLDEFRKHFAFFQDADSFEIKY
jgi:omega-amidase